MHNKNVPSLLTNTNAKQRTNIIILWQIVNAVYMEDCEGWWLSGGHGLVVEHWRLKPEVSWVRLLAAAGLFHFRLFVPHNI